MNTFQKLARAIIEKSFHLSVWAIEQFHDMSHFDNKAEKLRELPDGKLGKDIANCLEKCNLRLVPGYESHDLKHVLLGFEMTPVDEIRMQAFMIGNGNCSIPSLAIFLFGAILLPDLWATFYRDFQKGRQSTSIKTWTIEAFGNCHTSMLRQSVFNHSLVKDSKFELKPLIKIAALLSVFFGGSGMLYCLPFLFSSNLADLIGAGFPFVGGAILVGSGLVALSNLTRPNRGFEAATV